MNLEKITNKLSKFFELSDKKKKKEKNQQHLSKIIAKLKEKKKILQQEIQLEGENNETSERYQELDQEYKVVKKLLKRARKQYSAEEGNKDSE